MAYRVAETTKANTRKVKRNTQNKKFLLYISGDNRDLGAFETAGFGAAAVSFALASFRISKGLADWAAIFGLGFANVSGGFGAFTGGVIATVGVWTGMIGLG